MRVEAICTACEHESHWHVAQIDRHADVVVTCSHDECDCRYYA